MPHTNNFPKEKLLKSQTLRNNEYYDIQKEFDKLYAQSQNDKIFTNLMDLITDDRNLKLAFRNLKVNKGSRTRGVDGVTVDTVKVKDIDKYLAECREKFNKYEPSLVRRVHIPKGDGKTRPLGIPSFEDRIIQQAIKQILEPICEAKFYKNSFGFRPNRSVEHAVAKFLQYINIHNLHYVVDIDIKSFFDNVNHAKLIKQIWNLGIRDKNLICIVSKMLKSEVENEGRMTKGTPQGGILSPLLSNIVLNELDWWIDSQWDGMKLQKDYSIYRRGSVDYSNKYRAMRKTKLKEVKIVRYADDFKILCRNHKDAEKIFHAVRKWLKERLDLEISPEKSKITNLRRRKSEFLGFEFGLIKKSNKLVVKSQMTEKAKKKCIKNLKERIKFLQSRADFVNVQKYNATVLGMHNYYKIATNCAKDFSYIDYVVRKSLETRLRGKIKNKGNHSETYKRIYGKYKCKSYYMGGNELFPIYAMKHSNPMNLKTGICNYTEEGRKIIHSVAVGLDYRIIRYMISNPITTRSVQYNDNRISLFYGQKGLCGITKEFLEIGNFECHHKTPVSMGGTDEYKNLIIVTTDIHKLIHATEEDTILKYINEIKNLTDAMVKKVNKFRKLVGNDEIIINKNNF